MKNNINILNVQNVNDEEDICLHRTEAGAEKCLEEKKKYEPKKKFEIVDEEADKDLYKDIEE